MAIKINGNTVIDDSQNGTLTGTQSVAGNITGGNLRTAGVVSATGNVSGGNIISSGAITATGNITGNYILGNGSLLTGIITSVSSMSNGTSNVNIPTSGGNVTTSVAGNANILIVTGTGINVAGTLNSTGNANVGNLGVTGVFSTTLSATGNVTGGNLTTAGNITGQYIIGNGALLTGLAVTPTSITSGTSNVSIPTSSGNVTTSVGGVSNVLIVTSTGVNVAGTLNATGNANVGNIGATTGVITTGNITTINSGLMQNGTSNVAIVSGANVAIGVAGTTRITATSSGANVTGTLGVSSTLTASTLVSTVATGTAPLTVTSTTRVSNLNVATAGVANTVNDAAQPNITSVGNLTALSVVGNANIGNIGTAGIITATGNITSGNLITTGVFASTLSATGSATVATLTATTSVSTPTLSATSNIVVGNGVGGNITNANLISAATFSATGNITGNYILGNGAFLTGLAAGTANTAQTVTNAAQPNITSVGTLTSLSVSGNINAGNVIATHYGSGIGLTSIPGANVTGTVANATYATSAGSATSATSATTAGTVTTAAQPNITSVGTLTSLSVSGNANVGNIGATNGVFTNISGNGAALTNVTSNIANNIAGGTQYQIPIQTAANTTGFVTNFYLDTSSNSLYLPGYSAIRANRTLVVTTVNQYGSINIGPLGLTSSNVTDYSKYGNMSISAGSATGGSQGAGDVTITGGTVVGNLTANTFLPYAGDVNINGGNSFYAANRNGNVNITGGSGQVLGGFAGNRGPAGGSIIIKGADGPAIVSGTNTGNAGGIVSIIGGNATGTGNNAGGNITIRGGIPTGTGTVGNVLIGGNNNTIVTVTGTGVEITGNLAISGTSRRIIGDFDNANLQQRTSFVTSTTNASTGVMVIPNGTNTTAGIFSTNNSNAANAAYGGSYISGSAGYVIGTNITGTAAQVPILFSPAGAEAARFDTTGNLIIGGTAPAQATRFSVVGRTGLQSCAEFWLTGNPTSVTNCVWFGSSSQGTAGAVTVTNNTVNLASVSDYRMKTNVEPLLNAIERVKQLQPKRFNWLSAPDQPKVDGFLAHEVQAVVPNAAFGEKDAVNEDGSNKYQMMDAKELIPLLTAAIKEQQDIIEAQDEKITSLQNSLASVLERLAALENK